ncbi:MAG: hypothetical protein KAT15_09565, partial [Bacteroidales bacterium]|nr:hypothetical protein [Bacteroidales bacterium]
SFRVKCTRQGLFAKIAMNPTAEKCSSTATLYVIAATLLKNTVAGSIISTIRNRKDRVAWNAICQKVHTW